MCDAFNYQQSKLITQNFNQFCDRPGIESWASADFFPGEGKIFQGRGATTYYLSKNA